MRYEVDAPTLNHRVETVENVGRHWMLLEQRNVHQDFALLVRTQATIFRLFHEYNAMLYREVLPQAFP